MAAFIPALSGQAKKVIWGSLSDLAISGEASNLFEGGILPAIPSPDGSIAIAIPAAQEWGFFSVAEVGRLIDLV